MESSRPSDALSLFWAPLCAIGSHGETGPNAQIGVSVHGASIVPEQPRLIVGLYKTNHTTWLVADVGTLAISVLCEKQIDLLGRLGLESGRDKDKLSGLNFALTKSGDPYFPGSAGFIDCEVLDAMDAGDAFFFLCGVRERRWLTDEIPLDRARAMELAGEDFHQRWASKQAAERDASRATMRWILPR
ncbi:MAG TPA: flavin reductase family protein [Dehalococcoidia bacterium]|nr:flavin reductase family protein [Dehalococcoidia bacterium]